MKGADDGVVVGLRGFGVSGEIVMGSQSAAQSIMVVAVGMTCWRVPPGERIL